MELNDARPTSRAAAHNADYLSLPEPACIASKDVMSVSGVVMRRSRQVNVRLTEEEFAELQQLADKLGRTVSEVLRIAALAAVVEEAVR